MAKRGVMGAMMRGSGARDHDVTVTGTQWLAPHFVRVRMVSSTLLQDVDAGPTAFLRFWFPDPDDADAEQQRNYTLSEWDEATGEFACDFVIHDNEGPASSWARRAAPGTTVQAASLGSTRFALPEEVPAGYLLVGDSASIPSINAILGLVPDEVPIEVYLEEHEPNDRLIPLAEHPRASVHWVPRRGATSLAAAIEARDWSDWSAWMAAETGTLKHLRVRLRDEFGFPKSEVHAQAYWILGRLFGTKRSRERLESAIAASTTPAPLDPQAALDPEAVPVTVAAPAVGSEEGVPATAGSPGARPAPGKGSWRAQAGGRLIAPLRPVLIAAGIAQAIVTLIQLAPFVLLVELARLLLSGAEPARLWALGVWAVVLMGAGVVSSSALMIWLHWADARFARDLRQRLFTKLARLPLGWFDRHGSGQVKQLVQDDTLALHYLGTHAVPDAVAAVVAPVAVLVYLFAVDWRIALLLLLPVLVYVVLTAVMTMQSRSKIAELTRWSERMNVEAGAFLAGQPVIRVFGGAAASTFRARLGEYIGFLGDWQRPFVGQKTLTDLVTRPATFLALIAVAGTALVSTGSMAAVALLPFLLLGTTFGSRLLGIAYGIGGLRGGLLAARRIQNALDEPELEEAPATPAPGYDTPAGLVEFDGVGFAYRAGVPVLQDIRLTLRPGTVTALVGPSGSGKSTLAALLARFYDVNAGAIRIDGRDIRELTADELYSRVGFVFQQTQLIHGTVHDNIALAVPDAARERVEAAARAAQLHERIRRLPEGYDTLLGPDAALSGGERQRLTIARALLADPAVLVLDEATAFADPESEYLVQQALTRLTAGRTVLVVAHRLHTITDVDRIVVLDHGRIAESGTHTELLATGGRYRRLWDAGAPAPDVPAAPTTTPVATEAAR